ncbi:protein of unknown function [Taphrina deformans PYCC 5710]|uniref:NAD(P)H-hydrate epimerase n=1 Tax=Taphrina deformans (strain PYCC 5710 / ATCC 11124 / CBS 356.35 / IMI 108563 / JCM 9778 / NBRC 8474) TaxID=1097556 RepID=R4XI79_TAPDE|nr:protein of unknown function [Taphrina deformans PYCC 5710]|eukprot:CCG84189.1 protein of unknown function [Taphrina deformans PYCC 5710]
MKYITAEEATELDKQLMSEDSGWSLDQLMELAGLAVACAVHRATHGVPCTVLVIAGPGNNGGDGLVAARHLQLFGYTTEVYIPKKKGGIYSRLLNQLIGLGIVIHDSVDYSIGDGYGYIVDAIFGFSFSGDVRAPFDRTINELSQTRIPVLSVDAPSGWHIEDGQPAAGKVGANFYPTALISLSAPKPCSRHFRGRHFLGGRFLSEQFMRNYELPSYPGTDQIVELTGL